MDMVSCRKENGALVIALCGSIDSVNAPEVEEKIRTAIAENPSATILLDSDKLE